MEGADELPGLQFWNGDPTVRVFDADQEWNAMLLEACEPGTSLALLPEEDQDSVVAVLLRRLWRRPAATHSFRPLAKQLSDWGNETRNQSLQWMDSGLVQAGLRLFEVLAVPGPEDVLLATDLHAGNILRAEREPWLVIDPKPFVGDPAYDLSQHILNCPRRLQEDPRGLVARLADLAGVDGDRARLWLFARLAAEPRNDWDDGSVSLARRLE